MKRPTSVRRPAAALLLALCLPHGPGLLAQASAPPRDRHAAMEPFAAWVGSWKGSGWSMDATGQRTEFDLVETVTPKVGGAVLLVEGRGATKGEHGRTTHDGVVLVYYDERTGTYHWNGHDLASGPIDVEPRLIDGGFEWSFRTGAGGATIRFTVLFDATRWHEVGEVSVDGTSWDTFMDVQLLRANR